MNGMNPRHLAFLVGSVILVSAVPTVVIHAQSANLFLQSSDDAPAITLSATPQYPAPGQVVQISAQSAVTDLSGSTITWLQSGKQIAQGTGLTSATIIAGALGTRTTIECDVTLPDGTQTSSTIVIAPVQIDLLVDSDSYTPPFYTGRALPSPGTDIMLQAIPWLRDANGSPIASSKLRFTWKRNNQVVGSVSGIGRSSAVLASPNLFATDIIEVDVASLDGSVAGSASVILPSTEPQLVLYENHPLFGFEYYNALAAKNPISENEMTFAVVPYFAQASGPNDPNLEYQWTVNGNPVKGNAADQSEITISAVNSNGDATIGLSMTHATNLTIDSGGSWDILLSGSSSVFGSTDTGSASTVFGGASQ